MLEGVTRDTGQSILEDEELQELLEDPAIQEAIYERAKELAATGSTRTVRSGLRKALCRIIDSKNPALESACIGLAIDFPFLKEESVTSIAQRFGVTKAAVSKRMIAFATEADLPPSSHMKSAASRDTYRKTNARRRKIA